MFRVGSALGGTSNVTLGCFFVSNHDFRIQFVVFHLIARGLPVASLLRRSLFSLSRLTRKLLNFPSHDNGVLQNLDVDSLLLVTRVSLALNRR